MSSNEEDGKKEKQKRKKDDQYDPTPSNPRPVHNWSAPESFMSRQYGCSSKYSPDLFRFKCYGSLQMVQRLELMHRMEEHHDGCIITMNFNTAGTKLIAGSDAFDIILWDWTISEPIFKCRSGHFSNFFQAKFLPFSGDCHVVTCGRDGQVLLGELSTSGMYKRKLFEQKVAFHKLGLQKSNPHVFMTCGEDGLVYFFDVRLEGKKDNPQKLVTSIEKGKRVDLYSISCNPLKPFEYVVGGRSPYVKVYDTRFSSEDSACVKKFCPEHLASRDIETNVTSAVYNYNGEEILASYNEDIYLFSSKENESTKYLHRYRGHMNNQIIKEVNFFGAQSEYIVSGSDCGYIFFWDKKSEHIVKYMYADEFGLVNCIEPHPNMPVLAASGLDDDIKIFISSSKYEPDLSALRKHVIVNMREKEYSIGECTETYDNSSLFLTQHLSSARFRSTGIWSDDTNEDSSNSSAGLWSDNTNEESSNSSADEEGSQLQCTQS